MINYGIENVGSYLFREREEYRPKSSPRRLDHRVPSFRIIQIITRFLHSENLVIENAKTAIEL